MRVLNIYRTYFPDPPGGLQEAIRQITLATTENGVENTIFTLSPDNNPISLERPEARVMRARSWCAPASCDLGDLGSFRMFSQLAKESDILHYFFPWPFADLLRIATRPTVPSVVTYISDVVRQRWLCKAYAPLMWDTLKKARVIVANAPSYAQTSPILSHPLIRNKVRIIPLGIDEKSYPPTGDEQIFERLGLGDAEPFILFLGVLRYYKGIDFLIEAAGHLNAKIVIAGSGPEGERLRAKVFERGLENIVFAGQISDKEKVSLLKNCRALVLPSHLRSEAFGMVLVEAMMFAKPLISCEIGTGTSYVNKSGVTGYVVPPENSERLADAMNDLLSDELLAEKMGKAARQRYEKLFSAEALSRSYSDLYGELAAQA